ADDLQRHDAPRAALPGLVDDAHATLAERPEQLVAVALLTAGGFRCRTGPARRLGLRRVLSAVAERARRPGEVEVGETGDVIEGRGGLAESAAAPDFGKDQAAQQRLPYRLGGRGGELLDAGPRPPGGDGVPGRLEARDDLVAHGRPPRRRPAL